MTKYWDKTKNIYFLSVSGLRTIAVVSVNRAIRSNCSVVRRSAGLSPGSAYEKHVAVAPLPVAQY